MYRMTLGVFTILFACLLALSMANIARANEVKILAADFHHNSNNRWTVDVTLKHDDTGWDHYADEWRLVDDKGNVLADRVLFHPHVDEQPFTRGLSNIELPKSISTIYVEAHDKVHGWTPHRLKIDMSKSEHGALRVQAK